MLVTSAIILTNNSIANDYLVIVDKENNNYEIKESYDEIVNGEWLEKTKKCSFDILTSEIYSDKAFDQTEICNITQERINEITTIYPDGSKTVRTETEERTIEESTTEIAYGSHIETNCLNAYNFDNTLENDLYRLNIAGTEELMYCDMTRGGFTLVSHIYDRDNRDDILNNSNGAGWGDISNLPESDTSFNLANTRTPTFTEAEFEWIYPDFNESYRHDAMSLDLAKNRFAWVHPTPTVSYRPWHLVNDLKILNQNGYITGVFGIHPTHVEEFGFLVENHGCGSGQISDKAMHYWGYGSQIGYGNNSTFELHNLFDGGNRATGDGVIKGCGTRNSILNIWVK